MGVAGGLETWKSWCRIWWVVSGRSLIRWVMFFVRFLSSFLVGNEAHILVVVVVEVGIYSPFFHGHNGVYNRWKAWERKRLHVCLVLDFLVWFCSFETSF